MIEPIIIGDCTLYHGDNRDVLRQLPDNSIDSVCTDPPYALVSIVKRFGGANAAPAKGNDAYMRASAGFMGKQWDTGEVAFSEEFWSEVLRVLKPGGHVAAFGASRGYHRMACAIEDAGFEIRDSLMWIYGTGFPKSHDVSKGIDKAAGAEREVLRERYTTKRFKPGATVEAEGAWGKQDVAYTAVDTAPATPEAAQWEGWGTALKPAFEPIVLARKPLSEGTVAANVLRWGTGALNIDGCRVDAGGDKLGGGMVSKGRPKTSEGWDRPWMHDPEVTERKKLEAAAKVAAAEGLGRWPANVVHDGSDEVVGAFPDSKGQQGVVDGQTSKRNVYNDGVGPRPRAEPRGDSGSAARFFYSPKASKADRAGSKHPTVKPIALMEWLATLITPPDGTILDPFAGSGTTGAAAVRKGFKAVLCEREDEYVEDIKRRMSHALPVAAAVAAQPANDNEPSPQSSPSQLDIFGAAA